MPTKFSVELLKSFSDSVLTLMEVYPLPGPYMDTRDA